MYSSAFFKQITVLWNITHTHKKHTSNHHTSQEIEHWPYSRSISHAPSQTLLPPFSSKVTTILTSNSIDYTLAVFFFTFYEWNHNVHALLIGFFCSISFCACVCVKFICAVAWSYDFDSFHFCILFLFWWTLACFRKEYHK